MWVGAQPPGPHIRLSISDTGCGIPEDAFQKIFDPFFTTKDVGKGTGLGLAAVQGIIQSHGGNIQVESVQDEGTRFEIRIPRRDAGMPASADEPRVAGTGSGRVLVVDDEDQIVAMLRKSLERKGYEVTGMTNSRLALEAVENDPGRWDLVITDINMHELGGIQIARAIRSIRPDLPVILCSGSIGMVENEELEACQCSAVIAKPIKEGDLFHAIQRCINNDQTEGER
jgi:CheY-like chemotaxis protein